MGATQEGRVFHVLYVPAVGFGYPAFSSPGRQWFVASGHNIMTLCHASSASWFVGQEIKLGCYHIPAQALPLGCSWALIMREALALLLYNYAEPSPSLNIVLRP